MQDDPISLVAVGEPVEELSIQEECPERAENTPANTAPFI
jgi:hypothetical protein